MSERYDTDMENLKQRIREAKKQKEITANQEEMMADIAATIRALALGEKQDDTFYRNIVEKIVVHSREHIEIYLNLLPYKWSYMLAELPGNPSKKNGGSEEHFATSLPRETAVMFRLPYFGTGMVRWDSRYIAFRRLRG